jgi:hypothetical protein
MRFSLLRDLSLQDNVQMRRADQKFVTQILTAAQQQNNAVIICDRPEQANAGSRENPACE